MRQHLLYTLAGLALLGFAAGANAAVISGDVRIEGNATVDLTAESVTFTSGEANVTTGIDLFPMSGATAPSGDLTFNTVDWSAGTTLPATVWKFDNGSDTFEFKLDSITLTNPYTGTNSVYLEGTGTLYGTGFTENSNVSFSLFAGGTTGKQSYLSLTSASPVPLPAAGWLFGSAILGLAGIAKRRKAIKV